MEIIERLKEKEDINLLSPLTWAYVGDAVYELYIRTNLVNNTKLKPHKLHIESIKYVRAKAQADILKKIMNDLTEEEISKIRKELDSYLLEGDLRREVALNIKRLTEIGCYRGIRHRRGLPVRGQRTKTNARTRKGPRKLVSKSKKA